MVIDFIKYKKRLALKNQLAGGRTPLYISHMSGMISGSKEDNNVKMEDKIIKTREDIIRLRNLLDNIKHNQKG
jgi:hypothetical protein